MSFIGLYTVVSFNSVCWSLFFWFLFSPLYWPFVIICKFVEDNCSAHLPITFIVDQRALYCSVCYKPLIILLLWCLLYENVTRVKKAELWKSSWTDTALRFSIIYTSVLPAIAPIWGCFFSQRQTLRAVKNIYCRKLKLKSYLKVAFFSLWLYLYVVLSELSLTSSLCLKCRLSAWTWG